MVQTIVDGAKIVERFLTDGRYVLLVDLMNDRQVVDGHIANDHGRHAGAN